MFQNLLCLIRQCISGLNVPRRFKYWWWWNTTLLSGHFALFGEWEKGWNYGSCWLVEGKFWQVLEDKRFINISVGHLCRELGRGVFPETTNKEYAQLGDPSWLPSGLWLVWLMTLYFWIFWLGIVAYWCSGPS